MCSVDDLAVFITQTLEEYSEEVAQTLEEEKEKIATEAVQELKLKSPKGYRVSYSKGWRKTKKDKGWVIHNKEYRLTHLLEKGHAKRDGGRTREQPHIKIVEERVIKRFEESIVKKVQG